MQYLIHVVLYSICSYISPRINPVLRLQQKKIEKLDHTVGMIAADNLCRGCLM